MKVSPVLAVFAAASLGGCMTLDDFSDAPFDEEERVAPFPASAYAQGCEEWDDWDKPAEPFRLYGNTYYVGTCGITALLITSPDGHMLIDGGTEAGGKLVAENIAKLGFSLRNVRYVTHTQEHHDHVGGLAHLKEVTGARMVASARAQSVFETGILNEDDPQYEGPIEGLPKVAVDELVADGEAILLGGREVVAHYTPGHAPGAISWRWEECEDDACVTILFSDGLGPFAGDDYRWSDNPEYLAEYRASIDWLETVEADICMMAHPSQVKLISRIETGTIIDPQACATNAAATRERVDTIIAEEAADS